MSNQGKIIILLGMAVATLFFGVSIGGANIAPEEILSVFAHRLLAVPLPEGFESINTGLIWDIRLPRVLLAFIVGAALAVSGAIMQSVLKNPLASSYTIGVSAGAGVGAVIVIVGGLSSGLLGMFLMPAMALSFGLTAVFTALFLASRINHNLDTYSTVLMGMVLSIFCNAVIMVLSSKAPHYAQQIILWQMGSFSLKGWTVVGILSVVSVIGIVILLRFTKEMDILTFGDEQAGAIGIDVRRTKIVLILLSATLSAVSVAFVGIIGFVDLIAPHIIRRFFGSRHAYVVPLSGVFGGLFMVLADLVARTVTSPSEISVGAVTALIGAPFFAYIFVIKRRDNGV